MKRILLLAATGFLFYSVQAQTSSQDDQAGNKFSDSFLTSKTASSKRSAIKLYPNPSFGKLSVSANTASVLHFYIFDLDGTLVYQAVLTNKDRKSIEDLKKGTYLYDVFERDESIEEGKIVIK